MWIRKLAIATIAWSLAGGALALGGETPIYLLGSSVSNGVAERSIDISADTRWANVKQGESILFVVGAQRFGWKFDGPARSFDLQRVAPPGVLGRPLMVYVTPKVDPRRE